MKTIIIASMLFIAPSTFAAPVAELTRYFAESVQTTDEAVNQCSLTEPASEGEIWYFRRFWLRVRPKVSFAIPLIAKLEIVPELEMLWQR
jgi:hypothetical protein